VTVRSCRVQADQLVAKSCRTPSKLFDSEVLHFYRDQCADNHDESHVNAERANIGGDVRRQSADVAGNKSDNGGHDELVRDEADAEGKQETADDARKEDAKCADKGSNQRADDKRHGVLPLEVDVDNGDDREHQNNRVHHADGVAPLKRRAGDHAHRFGGPARTASDWETRACPATADDGRGINSSCVDGALTENSGVAGSAPLPRVLVHAGSASPRRLLVARDRAEAITR